MKRYRLRSLTVLLLLTPCALGQDTFFDEHYVVDGTLSYFVRNTAQNPERVPFRGPNGEQDFAKLKDAMGVNLGILSVSTIGSLQNQVRKIDGGAYGKARVVRKFSDVKRTRALGEYGVLMYVQMPFPLGGDTSRLADWYGQGLRVFQICYGETHPVAEEDILGAGSTEGPDESFGLTRLGREVVLELNRLGMIVDVSHCNRQTTLDVASLSTEPILATHANSERLTKVRRNKSDEELIAIADTGGVVGIAPIRWMIQDDTARTACLSEFVDHINYAVRLLGIDHVGLASDSDVDGWPADSGHFACRTLNLPDRWKRVYAALVREGYDEEELEKIFGGNFLRVFEAVLDD